MKKITILSLHLGYGGIEVAISDLANMLCEKYEVEIINLYGKNDPVYNINKSVKVINLINDVSNRYEFLNYLKKFRLFKTFKEGIRSIKILSQKKKKMKEAIINCDSDVIISTRVEFTELVNKYYKGKAVTISQEHNHHNNNQKYIRRVIKSLKNIDYFMPVSKSLTEFYKNKVNKAKVIYGPLCLDYIPEKESKRNNKNIISIGRLSPEKGYLDLIDVFYLISKKDNECMLHIIGDGSDKEKIENKIKQLDLQDRVIMYGFKDKEFIHEILYNMSLYLMTSYKESFGLVLLEASSYGIPCISFDSAGGANEIIKDGIDGYLIKDRNKNEMCDKSLELLNNKNKLNKFGDESRKKALNYSYDLVKKKWIKIIDEMTK